MTEGIQIVNEDNKVNIVMDMSIFDLFDLCAARYDYRHNHNKGVPMSKKSASLDKGGLAHEGLDVYFNGIKNEVHYNDRMHAAINRMRVVSADVNLCNLDDEDITKVISAVEESCDFWRHEDEFLIIHDVERAFARVIYEDEYIRIIITGKIDIYLTEPAVNGNEAYVNIPWDHKTYERDFEVSRLTNQFQNYADTVGSQYLRVNRIGLQKTLPPEDKFKRVRLSYDKDILDDWRRNVVHVILHEYLTCVETGYWPMSFTSCYAWNRKCEYYDICNTSGSANKAWKLEQDFATVSPWDVTAKFTKS